MYQGLTHKIVLMVTIISTIVIPFSHMISEMHLETSCALLWYICGHHDVFITSFTFLAHGLCPLVGLVDKTSFYDISKINASMRFLGNQLCIFY